MTRQVEIARERLSLIVPVVTGQTRALRAVEQFAARLSVAPYQVPLPLRRTPSANWKERSE